MLDSSSGSPAPAWSAAGTACASAVSPLRFRVGLGVAAAPVLVWLLTLAAATTDVPSGDDYLAILPFLSDWKSAASFSDHWAVLTDPFFAHRIVFTKLVVALEYAILGRGQLVALQVFGWLGWIIACALLLTRVPPVRRDPLLALPATLLLFQPQGYTNALCAIGLGNLWVLAFAFAAFTCVTDPTRPAIAPALGCALLATASFANGLLVWPLLTVGLLLRDRPRAALGLALLSVLVWTVYLRGHPGGAGAFSAGEFLRKLAAMAGGFTMVSRVPFGLALVAGGVLLALAAWVLSRPDFRRRQPALFLGLLFIAATLGLATLARLGWGDEYMVQDRYRIYGLLLVVTLYLAALAWLQRGHLLFAAPAAAFAAGFCLISYAHNLSALESGRRWQQVTRLNAQLGESFPHTAADSFAVATAALTRARTDGVFALTPLLSAADLARLRTLAAARTGPALTLESRPNGALIGHYLTPTTRDADQPIPAFALAIQSNRLLALPIILPRPTLLQTLRHGWFVGRNYAVALPTAAGLHGAFTVHLISRTPDQRLIVSGLDELKLAR